MQIMKICRSRRNGSLHKVDSTWSWVVCISGMICLILGYGICSSFGILYQDLLKELHETRERTAWVGSLAISFTHLGGVLAGFLCDRIGCRATAMIGSLSCSIGLLATSYVPSIWVMYFTYSILVGIGSSFLMTSTYCVDAKYFKRHLSISLALLGAGLTSGILVMSPLTRVLLDTFKLWDTLRILAAIELVNLLAACTFSPNVEVSEQPHEQTTSCQSEDENARGFGKIVDCSMWKAPTFVAYCLSADAAFFGAFIPQVHLAVHCEDMGINADSAAWLYVALGVASLFGSIAAGLLIDTITWISTRHIYQISLAVPGIATILCPLATAYSGLLAYVIVFGFFYGSFITCIDVLILTSMPDSCRAKAFGMYVSTISIPAAAGAPLAGLIADITKSYDVAFYMSGSVILIGAALPFMLLFTKKQERTEIYKKYIVAEEVVLIEKLTVV